MAVKLLVVGGGRLGSALVGGLVGAGRAPADIAVVEPVAEVRRVLVAAHPGLVARDTPDPELAGEAEGAVLAVKPQQAEGASRALGASGVRRLLSVVAGMPTARLEATLPAEAVVIRAMPNTPALIGAGASAIAGGSRATSADLAWAQSLLESVGVVVRVPEGQLDAVTGLSGSGPAYLFVVAEALIEAGVLLGLARETSQVLAVQTLLGSARLLAETGTDPALLRAEVTSPGGTTAAGLRALEARTVRSAFVEAVVAAAQRSANLAR